MKKRDWENTCTFTVFGEPKGKARARTVVLYDRSGRPVMKNGRVVTRTYTPSDTSEREKAFAIAFREAYRGRPLTEGPVGVEVNGFYSIAKSLSKAVKHARETNEEPCMKKPDLDNVEKLVYDALEGVVYKNDSQIVSKGGDKFWSNDPRTVVTVCW